MNVNLNTNISVGTVQQSALLQETEQQTEKPLRSLWGKGASVNVVEGGSDLEKLLSQFSNENENIQMKTAQNRLSAAFAQVLGVTSGLQGDTVQHLKSAEEAQKASNEYSKQIGDVQKSIDQKTTEINSLTSEKSELEKQIAAETDNDKKAELQKKLDSVNSQLSTANSKLTELNNQKTSLKEAKDKADQDVKKHMDAAISDPKALLAMANALKLTALDVQNILQNQAEKETEEETDSKLDKTDPVRIIAKALADNNPEEYLGEQKLLDEINQKRAATV